MQRRQVIKKIAKAAKTAELDWDIDREGANHTVYSLDGLMIPIARHRGLDDLYAEALYKECEPKLREGVVAMIHRFTVTRGDRYWLLYSPDVGRTTQARHLREAEAMARDLVASMTAADPEDVEVDLRYVLSDEVEKHLIRAQERHAEATAATQEASREFRAAARSLVGDGIPLRDVGVLLGVSHKRVHQLLQEPSER